ncbi:MAG: aminotransferase class I/II-fold pyridoxal phosphate-dependent enzyme [Phycisphaerales bacterium]
MERGVLVSERFAPFGTTIFAEMTRLAQEHGAVNLSQGFPDFDGPRFVREAAARATTGGDASANQYARMQGVPALNGIIARQWSERTGLACDPNREVTVTAGCTEALAASFLGLLNPGDEVVMFEPFYDSYRACATMAGAQVKFVPLRSGLGANGTFGFDEGELRAAFTSRTRAILVNTPHNPTGKVFTRAELETIARLCIEHDVIAITDEVYERLVYEHDTPHISLATLEGMAERTVTLSSLGKTFSLTGWKIGWAVAPWGLSAGVRAAHQFLTFAVATPLQHAAAEALEHGEDYVRGLVSEYRESRDYLAGVLERAGLRAFPTEGTYFIMADHSALGFEDDVAFCRHLTVEVGVAAIPPSAFYSHKELGKHLVRFAFCKKRKTLEEAAKRLERLT